MVKLKRLDIDAKPVDFNMSVAFLERLDRYLGEKDVAAASGDLLTWFRWLKVIWSNIIWKVRQEGNEEREDKVAKKLSSIEVSFLKNIDKTHYTTIEQALGEIDKEINQLLYDYGLLYVERKNRRRNPKEALELDYLGEF